MQGDVRKLQRFYGKMEVCGKNELRGHVEREGEHLHFFVVET
jgi:hypothetical protein